MREQVPFESKTAQELFGKPAAFIAGRAGIDRYFRVADDFGKFTQLIGKLGLKSDFAQSNIGIISSQDDPNYVVVHNFDSDNAGVWVSNDHIQRYAELLGIKIGENQ